MPLGQRVQRVLHQCPGLADQRGFLRCGQIAADTGQLLAGLFLVGVLLVLALARAGAAPVRSASSAC